jgi:hypothetical protein
VRPSYHGLRECHPTASRSHDWHNRPWAGLCRWWDSLDR